MEMKPATPETVRRRKAMLLGLQNVLSREQSLLCLLLWERDFGASASSFEGLHQFARIACDAFGKVGRRVDLQRALLDALRRPVADLPLDPTRDMELVLRRLSRGDLRFPGDGATAVAPRPKDAPTEAAAPAHVVTFSMMVRMLEQEFRRANLRGWLDAVSYLSSCLPRMGLLASTQRDLAAWIAGDKGEPFPGPMNERHVALVVHTLYVGAAEAIGPVPTDRIFGEAVRAVTATPEGHAYPPAALL
jgi:hypothetical protein